MTHLLNTKDIAPPAGAPDSPHWIPKAALFISSLAALIAAASAGISAYQVWTVRDNAQRQLRAYVIVDSVNINKIEPGSLLVGFTASNVGQTLWL